MRRTDGRTCERAALLDTCGVRAYVRESFYNEADACTSVNGVPPAEEKVAFSTRAGKVAIAFTFDTPYLAPRWGALGRASQRGANEALGAQSL